MVCPQFAAPKSPIHTVNSTSIVCASSHAICSGSGQPFGSEWGLKDLEVVAGRVWHERLFVPDLYMEHCCC